jgi:hypothetical protein
MRLSTGVTALNTGTLDDQVAARLLHQRIIVLGAEVEDTVANRLCGQLLLLSAEDPRVLLFVIFLLGSGVAGWLEFRKTKIAAAQAEAVRQLVGRYEQLAESTLDAQQRTAADVAELRSRTAAIEQILRTVE